MPPRARPDPRHRTADPTPAIVRRTRPHHRTADPTIAIVRRTRPPPSYGGSDLYHRAADPIPITVWRTRLPPSFGVPDHRHRTADPTPITVRRTRPRALCAATSGSARRSSQPHRRSRMLSGTDRRHVRPLSGWMATKSLAQFASTTLFDVPFVDWYAHPIVRRPVRRLVRPPPLLHTMTHTLSRHGMHRLNVFHRNQSTIVIVTEGKRKACCAENNLHYTYVASIITRITCTVCLV